MAAQRREEILDALETTVAEHGLENATLQRIADRAGITRSAIAHFIGNRDEVIDAAATRSVERIRRQFDATLRSVRAEDRLDAFIDLVFTRDPDDRETIMDLNDELVALAHRNVHARERLADLYDGFEAMISGMLRQLYPSAADDEVATVALSSVLLLREADRVSTLALTERPELVRPRASRAVRLLFDSLADG